MRKALLIGIDAYSTAPLKCCVNDVNGLSVALANNFDLSANFSIKTIINEKATRANVRTQIRELFEGEGEIALLYFSGHGVDDVYDGSIVTIDFVKNDYGIRMTEILELANNSKMKYKIIILDCCHAGFLGTPGLLGDTSSLAEGVIILTASKKDQVSKEINGHGIFTNLLLEGLNGGACDLLGRVTPGSIYAFIDQALGPWEQRPLFKANISSFISLRQCHPFIKIKDLKETMNLFVNDNSNYLLDPSYEKTNYKGSKHRTCEPYMNEKNVEILTKLQKLNRCGLVNPVGCEDMYFAAMESKSCCLTPLGKHYWKLVKEGKI